MSDAIRPLIAGNWKMNGLKASTAEFEAMLAGTGSLPDGATSTNLVVAYEPVWAIGTGLTPTRADVEQVHRFIRGVLSDRFKAEGGKIRILYGGSVKPSNALELMGVADVNGALVGGASLKSAEFLAIAAGAVSAIRFQ